MKLNILLVCVLALASRGFGQNSTEGVNEDEEDEEYFEDGLSYNATDILAENGTDIDFDDNSTDTSAANTTLAPNATSVSIVSTNTTSLTTPTPSTNTPAPVYFPESAVGEIVCTCDLRARIYCNFNDINIYCNAKII